MEVITHQEIGDRSTATTFATNSPIFLEESWERKPSRSNASVADGIGTGSNVKKHSYSVDARLEVAPQ